MSFPTRSKVFAPWTSAAGGGIYQLMETVALGKVLQDVLEGHRCAILENGIQVSVHLDPVTVLSDADTLSRVFSTIIGHAIHSRRKGSRMKIDVRSRTTEDEIAVVFGHDGKGLSGREKSEGFMAWCLPQPGSLSQSAKKDALRTLVDELGGRIVMEKASGGKRGTMVTVRLPR